MRPLRAGGTHRRTLGPAPYEWTCEDFGTLHTQLPNCGPRKLGGKASQYRCHAHDAQIASVAVTGFMPSGNPEAKH